MSIVNVWIGSDRALVAVDTATQAPSGVRGEGSKLLTNPHASFVIASRGSLTLLGCVQAVLCSIGGDMDTVESQLPKMLPDLMSHVRRQVFVAGRDVDAFEEQDLFVVGWSPRRAKMAGTCYRKVKGEEFHQAHPINPWVLGPWDSAAMGKAPLPSTAEAMETITRAQAAHFNKVHPAGGFGGRMVLAEISRDSITTTQRCELG